MPDPLPRLPGHRLGEPRASIYTPDWVEGQRQVARMRGRMRKSYAALFAHLELGWTAIRPLQLAAEAMMIPDEREGDVGAFVYGQVTEYYRELALDALLLIPGFTIPALRHLGAEPMPIDDVVSVAEMVARHVRLLALAESAPGFADPYRGIVGPAAEALTAWEATIGPLAAPVVAYAEREAG